MKVIRRKISRAYATVTLLSAGCLVTAQAQEYIRAQATAPESVEELPTPIIVAFPEPEPIPTALFPKAKETLQSYPPFVSDLTLNANFRTYYFLRNNDGIVTNTPDKSEAWAAGGSIASESGRAWETLSIGGEFFASVPIVAPDSRPGSGLLKPIQDSIYVLGQAYARLRMGKERNQVVTLGRQRYDLPYLNSNDSRMIPNTFEGYTIDGRWPFGRFVAGYVAKIKPRASNEFIPMSRGLGVQGKDRGVVLLGMRYESDDAFKLGIIANVVPDVLSTIYSELDTNWTVGEWGFRFGAQFTDQRSVGDDLLTGSSFNTQSGGMRLAVSFRHAMLTTAFDANSDGERIRTPFGGSPSFTSLMLSNFDLAGQRTFRVGLSYDCGRIGIPGLSGFVNYARGVDAENPLTGALLPDSGEIDLTLDYRRDRVARGVPWLRLRAAHINFDGGRSITQYRVIFNWNFQVL